MINARKRKANFQMADMLRHEYPPGTSLHAIVKDLKSKGASQ